MLADDNPNEALLLGLALREAGFRIPMKIVNDGQQVLDYLSGNGHYADRSKYPVPDIILMDLHMPRIDGFGVLSWLRQQPEFRHLPVVVLTGSKLSADSARAYECGAKSVVIKAHDFRQFAQDSTQAIRSCLSGLKTRAVADVSTPAV